MQTNLPRRRATNPAFVVAALAKTVATPARSKLASWNEDLARLRAVATMRVAEIDRARVANLKREISSAHREFLAQRGDSEEIVATHSMLRDVDRSYIRLLEQLSALER